MTDEKIEWPDWREVEQGQSSIPGTRAVTWPKPGIMGERPMLRVHQMNKPRRLLRVVCENPRGNINGYLVTKGVNYLLVYEHELPAIQKRVRSARDMQLFALAQEQYEVELAEHIKTIGTRPGDNPQTIRERAEATIGASPYNIMRRMDVKSTGLPPLSRIDIHPDLVPPPETPESSAAAAAHAQAEAMGQALAKHLGSVKQRAAG